jgi:hypothetical protein
MSTGGLIAPSVTSRCTAQHVEYNFESFRKIFTLTRYNLAVFFAHKHELLVNVRRRRVALANRHSVHAMRSSQ